MFIHDTRFEGALQIRGADFGRMLLKRFCENDRKKDFQLVRIFANAGQGIRMALILQGKRFSEILISFQLLRWSYRVTPAHS